MPTVSTPTHIKLQNILFATDFSPSARVGLSYTLHLAHAYDAEVFAVSVLPHMPFVEAAPPDPEQMRLLAEERMNQVVAAESLRGVRHQELIEEGEVPEVLSRLVRRYDIDLIVIGTGGRKGLEKLLLGSVAEEIFRNAECPVLTVGPRTTPWPIGARMQHILFATDFGPESVHALPYAISLAEENHARLTLLHVASEPAMALPELERGRLPVTDREKETTSRERQLRSLIPEANQLWRAPEYNVQFGSPAETILKAAQTADLIVLGVKRPAAFTKHLGGGVAYTVARESLCPVLSVGARYRG